MENEQIKYMVSRFLGWKLPESFNPDGGISFKKEFNKHTEHLMKHEPSGTNLFDANQAEEMVRYMLEEMPNTHKSIVSKLYTPKNAAHFDGEFIVFFSEDPDCEVLFHSIIAENSHADAERIFKETGRRPTVIRIDCRPHN